MNAKNLGGLAAAVVVAGMGAMLVIGGHDTTGPTAPAAVEPGAFRRGEDAGEARAQPPMAEGLATQPGSEEAASRTVRVRAGRVLATVNGTPIRLKHLVPIGDAVRKHVMTREEFRYRLNQAIETELTFQAAERQAVELTGMQQALLDQVRDRYLERAGDPTVVWSTSTQASYDLEVRLATAQMLQANLLLQAGMPSPNVSAREVGQYYAANSGNWPPLPTTPAERQAAWQKIDIEIRRTLNDQYPAARKEYLRQLKADADLRG